MTCTTFLYESDINNILADKEVQALLDEVRKKTGKDWQVVKHQYSIKKNWFLPTKTIERYGVYVFVGGFGPWQQINFYSTDECSMSFYVTLDVVANYLMGILVGLDAKDKNGQN